MKRILFLCSFLLIGLGSFAGEATTDYLTISDLTLNPGGKYGTISVTLNGSRKYTAFGFDLYLPDGYAFDPSTAGNWTTAISSKVEKYDIYPYEEDEREGTKTYSHTLSANLQSDGALRITAYSSESAEFLNNSGVIVKVYVKATTYAKPGAADVKIKNCFFTTSAGVQYDAADQTISDKLSASSSATANLSLSGTTKWSTLILPFDADLPTGVSAYTCTERDETNKVLKLTPATAIEAYTPYIVYTESDNSSQLTGTVDASKYPASGIVSAGLLNGAITTQSITTGYVLQNLTEGVRFYNCSGDKFTIPAGKCWVTIPSYSAKGYGFKIMDASGIRDVEVSGTQSDKVYNLAGQRTTMLQHGNVYIVNGKKIVK